MSAYILKCCSDCDGVKDALRQLDVKISSMTTNNYRNRVFQLTIPFDMEKLKILLMYKRLLLNLFWNKDYYHPYDYKTIVSKAKTLI